MLDEIARLCEKVPTVSVIDNAVVIVLVLEEATRKTERSVTSPPMYPVAFIVLSPGFEQQARKSQQRGLCQFHSLMVKLIKHIVAARLIIAGPTIDKSLSQIQSP
jgi:hypothetical protein